MPHANTPLSELGRLRLARFHVESGSTIRATAERFQVSTTTVIRWSGRYRAVSGSPRRPSTRSWSGRGSTASITWIGPQEKSCAATSATTLETSSMSISRSSASSLRAGVGRPTAERMLRPDVTDARSSIGPTARPGAPAGPATPTCSHLSMIDPASPTAKSTTTRPQPPAWSLAASSRALRLAWHPSSRGHHGQWCLSPQPRLARRQRRHGHHRPIHPPLPATDERQGRALPPHPARRMGIRQGLDGLATRLQPSQARHRTQRPTADHPRDLRPWAEQLGGPGR